MYLEVELQMDTQLMQVQGAFPGDHCVQEQHCLGGRRKAIINTAGKRLLKQVKTQVWEFLGIP